MRDAPRGCDRGFRLSERQPRVIEKSPAGRGELHPADTALKKLGADLQFQIADLSAERGLRSVQPFLGREIKAAFFGDGNEIAEMSELHDRVYAS